LGVWGTHPGLADRAKRKQGLTEQDVLGQYLRPTIVDARWKLVNSLMEQRNGDRTLNTKRPLPGKFFAFESGRLIRRNLIIRFMQELRV
jgi:hypothetical protein